MKIKELSLKNFRGFDEVNIKFSSSNLTVFIGINGSGKSSILDSIAIFLSQFILKLTRKKRGLGIEFSLSDKDIKMEPSSEIRTLNTITLSPDSKETGFDKIEFAVSKILSGYEKEEKRDEHDDDFDTYIKQILSQIKYNPHSNLPVFIYYQTNRAIFNLKSSKQQRKSIIKQFLAHEQFLAYENAFAKNITNLSDFLTWFRYEEDIENEIKIKEKDFNAVNKNLEVVRNAITHFLNKFTFCQFSHLRVERGDKEKIFNFSPIEKSSLVVNKNNQKLEIDQLSEGEKLILLMISDIARRLAIANPSLNNPIEGKGIVLIDEIDLHLHPQWQRDVIPSLLYTFPNIQFIVTTHSPQVLSNIEKEEIRILQDFKIVEKTPHTKGRDTNSILYELQGVEERPKLYQDKLREIYRKIDNEKIDEAKKLLFELTEKFGKDDSEILNITMHINFITEEK